VNGWIKAILTLVIVSVAAFGGWKAFGGKQAPASTLPTVKAETREVEEFVRATGEVAPAVVTEIRSENSGQVAKIHVRPGAKVRKGDILCELDRAELESQIDESTLQIEATKLQSEKANRDAERWQKLFDQKIAPEKELLDARTEAALAANNYQLQQARLETLRRRLEKTIIASPQDGVVLEVNVEEGQVIVGANGASAGTLLMKAADLGNLLIKANINEVDVAKLTPGMPLAVSYESVPAVQSSGVLSFISPAASSKEKEKDIRAFPLTVSLEAADERIRPGISADMKFSVAKETGVSVEVASVFRDKEENYVFRREGDRFQKRPVSLGINSAKYVIITEGLKEGDEVALERPPDLSPVAGKKPQS
jgi:RND family efflux transporter MFP subunit